MIKLTRLNNHVVAINPDHIGWADATPDTTLFMFNGEKIIIRETLDELIACVIDFRKRVRAVDDGSTLGACEGDPPRTPSVAPARRISEAPARRVSETPSSLRLRGGM